MHFAIVAEIGNDLIIFFDLFSAVSEKARNLILYSNYLNHVFTSIKVLTKTQHPIMPRLHERFLSRAGDAIFFRLAVFILETHNPSRRIMRLLCYPSGVKTGRTVRDA